MAKVPNGVETLPKVSIARVGCTNVTDDRQTDGRTTTYSEHEHKFTFAKNRCILLPLFGLTSRRRGYPGTISVKFLSVTDGHGTKWRRNNAKNFNRLSRVHERYRRQTDRQTDRRLIDGRTTTYSDAFAKKQWCF